jgi:hypothetical protein
MDETDKNSFILEELLYWLKNVAWEVCVKIDIRESGHEDLNYTELD